MRGEEEERCEGKKRDGKQERRDEEKIDIFALAILFSILKLIISLILTFS